MSTKCVRPRGAAATRRGASSPGRCVSVTARRSRRQQPHVRTRSGRAPAGAPCAGACLTLRAKPRRDRASPRPRHRRNAPRGAVSPSADGRRELGGAGASAAGAARPPGGSSPARAGGGRRLRPHGGAGGESPAPGAGGERTGGQGRRGAAPVTARARGSRDPRPAAPRARTPPRARPGGGSLSWRGDGGESLPGAGTKMAPRFPASPATPPRQLSPASAAALPASAAWRARGACRAGAAGSGPGRVQ